LKLNKDISYLLKFLSLTHEGNITFCNDDITSKLWKSVLALSIKHHVNYLFYKNIKTYNLSHLVPEDILAKLHELYFQNTAKNIIFFEQLKKVLALLQENDLSFIILKGAYLLENVYEDVGARDISDVDFLFKHDEYEKAVKILIDKGYLGPKSPLEIDPHLYLERDVSIDDEEIWHNARMVQVAGFDVLALSNEHLILHLCLHTAYHHLFQYIGLRTLCDIKEITEKNSSEIDWNKVAKTAQVWGADKSVFVCLSLVKELLSVKSIELKYFDYLKDKNEISLLKEWAFNQIFYEEDDIDNISLFFLKLLTKRPFKEKLICLKRLLFPPKDEIIHKYIDSDKSQKINIYFSRLNKEILRYIKFTYKYMTDPQIKLKFRKLLKLYETKERFLNHNKL